MGEKRKSDKKDMKPRKEKHDDKREDASMLKKKVKKSCLK